MEITGIKSNATNVFNCALNPPFFPVVLKTETSDCLIQKRIFYMHHKMHPKVLLFELILSICIQDFLTADKETSITACQLKKKSVCHQLGSFESTYER